MFLKKNVICGLGLLEIAYKNENVWYYHYYL